MNYKVALATATLMLAGTAAAKDDRPCGTGLICASAPQTVAAAMTRAGFQALVGKDNVGDPQVESSAAGYRFTVLFYGCDNHAKCDSLQFYASFDGDPSRGAAFANKWNADNRFAQMSIRPDNTIVLNYDVSTVGGLNQTNFADVIDWWSTVLGAYSRYAAENPVRPAAARPAV